jgi:hypothetical protein
MDSPKVIEHEMQGDGMGQVLHHPLNRLDNRPPGRLNFLFELGFTKVGDD